MFHLVIYMYCVLGFNKIITRAWCTRAGHRKYTGLTVYPPSRTLQLLRISFSLIIHF